MAFDKAKVMRAAEKHLAQGKISAAIKEYSQIVDHEPDDFTALNMLGDLYVRQNDKNRALQCFLRIAEHYREEGFQSKAIAMYKKIDRLNPRSPEIANKLASLYESQGLFVDARAQYMVVAETWLKDGQTRKALEIFRKVADLDPQNTDARVKLAQSYMREGMEQEAAEAFGEAGAQFLAAKDYDNAIGAYIKALDLRPLEYSALGGFLDAHVAMGTPDEAAEALEHALAQRPGDVELLSMLATAYVEAESGEAAERVIASLAEQDPASNQRFVEVVRLYLKTGQTDDAVRVLSRVTEQMLSGREEEKLMELLNEALALDPEHVEALRLLVRVYAWQRDDEKQRQTLERLVEAAEAAGLPEVERSAILQLAQFAPDQRYLERLQALGHAPEYSAEEPPAASSSYDDVPSFDNFSLVDDHAATSMGVPGAEDVVEFEFNSVAQPPTQPSTQKDPSASFADLNEDWASSAETQASPVHGEPSTGFQEIDFGGTTSAGAPQAEAETGAEGGALDPRREGLLRQELDSVDFYLAQGYMDIAADTLEMLERQFGSHAEIEARRARLDLKPAAPDEPAPAPEVEYQGFTSYDVAEEVAPEDAEELDVAELIAEAPAPQAPAAKAPMEEPTAKAPEPAPAPSGSAPALDPGLAAIFDEFREAAEEESHVSDGDFETHYNLGIAYKEMELLDEAVEEFQSAASMTAAGDGTPRYLQCCNMLGHCFMEKGMPRLAVMWFKKGLAAPGHEEEHQALRFELGTAYEQMGDLDSAIDVFSEVYGHNISYRGVAEKLRDLQAQKAVKSES